ncbi:hypothetical protein CBOM_06542 [Ceraceosorus bombacis]|uniref:Uncharacterized protein n=1 Tax=Ceraceosorus bombacis TaxID=401625 RepID=A0A0P1BJN3_9BASI|nr:hypothetical protein CBOM_06542 [Ceraceosorus bombacis]
MEDFTESYASSAFDELLTEPISSTTHLESQGEASNTYWDDLVDWVRSQEGMESASDASLGLFEAYDVGVHDGTSSEAPGVPSGEWDEPESENGGSALEELFSPQHTISTAQHQPAIQSAWDAVTVDSFMPPIDPQLLEAAPASIPTPEDFQFEGVDDLTNNYIPPFGSGEVIYNDPPHNHHYNRALGASPTPSELDYSPAYLPCITNNAQHLPARPTAPQASGANSTVDWDKFKHQLVNSLDIDDMKAFFAAHGIELQQQDSSALALAQPTLPRVVKVYSHAVRRNSYKAYIKYKVLYEGHHRSSILTPIWLPYNAPHPGFAAAIRIYFLDKNHWVSTSSLNHLKASDPDFWTPRKSLIKHMSIKGHRL